LINSVIVPVLLFLAESEGQEGFWKNKALWRVINLAIFILFLVYILRSKVRIGQVFETRAATIVKELEQAKRDKQEAEARLSELESRLSRLDQDVESIRREAEQESAREAERVRQAAASDAEKIRATARREIEGAMKAARTELRAFVADASVAMAEGIIRREIRPEDNSRMLNKYIDDLREVNK
jgi:F-type H+-transporting ATPase subunit b